VALSWAGEQGGLLEPITRLASNLNKGRQAGAESERGLPVEVFKLKSPLLISSVQTDSRVSDPEFLRAAGFVTYLGLPMIVKDEILGVLSFYSTEAIDLRTEEEAFLTDLTHHAAIALYNSRLYEQIRNQAAELEKSNCIKDEFLGVISHELRTPVNIIMNSAECLKMGIFGEITPEHEKGTEKIRMQASHLLSLINGILEITKIETGGIALNLEQINLYELVSELESDYVIVTKEKNLAINWRTPTTLPNIMCDRMKLRQVVMNLIDNAIKFTDQGSVDISFRSLDDEPFVEIAVADTGIGIASEFLPHIFEKFRQIDSTTTRHYSGTGLGLYLVQSFVERLGGSVSVQSKLGAGTTFTVRVPFRAGHNFLGDNGVSPEILTAGVLSGAHLEREI
jgi:signal transduction histidine kinase